MAVDTGIADAFAAGDVDATCQVLKGTPAGEAWIASFQESAEPWFNFSTGSGFYHSDKIWIENVGIPFDFIHNYISKLQNGDDLARPMEAIRAERDRIVNEYAELLPTRRGSRGVPGQAGPGPRRVPVRGEPQLLRRALEPLGDLAQDAPARRAVRQGGLLVRGERHLLPQADRGRGGALGLLRLVGDPGSCRRTRLLAPGDRAPARDPRGAVGLEADAGHGRAAGGHHRAVHRHAVGHHLRQRRRRGSAAARARTAP